MNIEELKYGPLTVDNIKAVYEMCETDNVRFISQPFETFKRATLESGLFNPELTVVASDQNGKIAAFFMVVLREPFVLKKRKVAVLKFFVVEKSWRYKGLGTKIFKILHLRVKENKNFKMKFEVMTSLPDYWCPGLDPRQTEAFFFLKKMGFKKGKERINLCVDLDTIPDTQPPSEHRGYKLSRATPDDREELVPLRFMPKGYQLGFWPHEVDLTFQLEPIPTFIAKDPKTGKIVGWASHSIHYPGSFGPTGVSKKLQGQGLGGVLLNWCLWDIKQTGLKTCKIMWVTGNTVYFYLKSKGAYIGEFFWKMKRRV